MPTYVPLFDVGASSEVTASAVSSLIPAPAPEIVMPAMKMFIVCAVEQTIFKNRQQIHPGHVYTKETNTCPMTIRAEPRRAIYLLPITSLRDPTKGHTAARERRFASTSQTQQSAPPRSA